MSGTATGPTFAAGWSATGAEVPIPEHARRIPIPSDTTAALVAEAATGAVVRSAFDWLDDHLPPRLNTPDVPLMLVATEHCVAMASEFVETCLSGRPRLPPLVSVRMESTQLLRRFVRERAWHGPCFVLVTPTDSVDIALAWARDVVTTDQQPGVVVSEIRRRTAEHGPELLVTAAAVLADPVGGGG